MNTPHPSVLLVSARWWALSARLAICFLRNHCRVQALCPEHHPLTFVSGIETLHHYSGRDSLADLHRALAESDADIVIPCDDGAVAQLHALHRREPAVRALIERSLGPPQGYAIVESRYELLRLAIELGIRVPTTARLGAADDLARWHAGADAKAVLKVDGSCGGFGVRIAGSLDQADAARRELAKRPSAATAWKRQFIDRDPLAVWSQGNARPADITVQQFVAGRPANLMAACWQGRVLATLSVAVVASDGETGAATIVRPIDNPQMVQAAERLAARLQISGFCGLDFMLDSGTGAPYLIEMNPRSTQLGHLCVSDRGSLADVLCAELSGASRGACSKPIRAPTIAFFPQKKPKTAAGATPLAAIAHAHQDIPLEHPALIRELMLPPWPERQWAARLYHALKPIEYAPPVYYE